MSAGIRRSTRNAALASAGALVITFCGFAGVAQAEENTTHVRKDGDTLRITADNNKQNDIVIEKMATDFLVTDQGDTVAPGTGCAAVNANTVRCAAAGIARVDADGRNRDDTINAGAADTPSTLRGGGGVDTLMGSNKNDRIEGGDGNDAMLNGDAGDDRIYGGNGDDMINSEDGNDYGEGGPGNDMLNGGDDAGGVLGNDHLIGGPGRDTINGGPGNDRLEGNAGTDTINGDPGDDVLTGGPDKDTLDGGTGTDTCRDGNDTKANCER